MRLLISQRLSFDLSQLWQALDANRPDADCREHASSMLGSFLLSYWPDLVPVSGTCNLLSMSFLFEEIMSCHSCGPG